jgi:hypothetical protein
MARDYPLEKVRNIGIIAHIKAAPASAVALRTPRFSTFAGSLLSATEKFPFFRPFSLAAMFTNINNN